VTSLPFRVLDPASGEALRIAAALVFAEAAIGKFRGPAAFRRILAGYRLLPSAATGPVARALPVIEAAVALLVPVRVALPWPSLAAAALLLLFAAAMAINLLRGRAGIECGCAFAAGRQPGLRWSAVGLDVGLACALLCAPADQPLSLPQAVTACLAGLAVFLLIQAGNALSALGPVAARPARTRL
jgi:hypothetical protein